MKIFGTTEQVKGIFQHHFARMWPERHNPHTRASIRANIRGQRSVNERIRQASQ